MADFQLHIQHSPPTSQLSNMENPKPSFSSSNENVSLQENKILEEIREEKLINPVENDAFNGRSMLGFSLTSPDLVICSGSPDIAGNYGVPNFLEENNRSVELSLENGLCRSDMEQTLKTPSVKFSMVTETFNRELSPDSSFELLPQLGKDEELPQVLFPGISFNAGSSYKAEAEDGDVERVNDAIGNAEYESQKDEGGHMEGDYQKLLRDFELQKRELEALRRENQLKDKECQDAWKSLQELQNELMRKSMHVGSLAFAVEGQVKEKSKWFSSLRNITRKLKIMKMEHMELAENAGEYMKYLADLNEIMSNVQSTIKQQSDLHKDLETRFLHGARERKELYNKVLELKGNIRVFCRCRPLNSEELASGASCSVDFDSAKDGDLTVNTNGIPKKTFKFDAVFGPHASQADVFQDTAPVATSVLDGYNVCIFAYGQTGTGKTFTMEGTEKDRGVNFRTLEQLFSIIKEREKIFQYDVSVSVLEVYNDQIRDLLVSESQPAATTKRLEIRQVSEGWHHVPGLVEAHVNNMSEVWDVLQRGSNARAVGSTNSNEHSSRSHCLTCVMVKGENLLNGECAKSKLWLVDLAGSERVAKTEVQGERLKETQNINKSLSALGDVISALTTKSPHIPFRNSKLTHLLQDSLGGDSKTLMFVQISPSENDLGETLCSLNFASRVRGIELGPAKRQLETSEVLRYRMMLEKSKQELKIKDMQVKRMEETSHGLEMKMKEKELKNRNLQERVKELEAQLLVERKLARQHVDTKIAELQQRKQQQDEQNNNAPLRQPLLDRLVDVTVNHIDPAEKENSNPNLAALTIIPKKTGRASICTTFQPISTTSASRRNSLIPLPSCTTLSRAPPPLLPLSQISIKEDAKMSETSCTPEQTHCDSPKKTRSIGPKKLNSIIRRSLQKKMQMKSPRQQRNGGINVGIEKVRLSIGSRSKIARRVLMTNGKRAGVMDTSQKQNQKEKERGWNIGTLGRTAI